MSHLERRSVTATASEAPRSVKVEGEHAPDLVDGSQTIDLVWGAVTAVGAVDPDVHLRVVENADLYVAPPLLGEHNVDVRRWLTKETNR